MAKGGSAWTGSGRGTSLCPASLLLLMGGLPLIAAGTALKVAGMAIRNE